MLTLQDCEKLAEALSDAWEIAKKFVHVEKVFDILYSTLLWSGHSERDRMTKQLEILYKNITQAQIKMFFVFMQTLSTKTKMLKKNDCCKADYFSQFQ